VTFSLKKNILYEDDHLIAINKPSGMLVLLDRWQKEKGRTLLDFLQKSSKQKIYIVHRLDRDTSGVICFAKSDKANRALCRMFTKLEIQKTYRGLVHGRLTKDKGVINKPIAQSRRSKGLMIIDKRTGKEAVTEIEVLERFSEYSWLKISIRTGRTHQIRVHLTSIGHPLVCDRFYGLLNDEIYLSKLKKEYKKRGHEKPLLSRLALHALSLEFKHPVTSKTVKIESPLPKDLKATVHQLLKREPQSQKG